MLLFPAPTDLLRKTEDTRIPRFDATQDPEGAASYVPHMDHFYDNSVQSAQMRDLAVDFELLDEHLVLLGNQVRFHVSPHASPRFVQLLLGCRQEQDHRSVMPGGGIWFLYITRC